MNKHRMTYAKSGVDIEGEEKVVKAISGYLRARTGLGAPLLKHGHYSGLIDLGDTALAMTTDGVGSKTIVANEMRKWDTIGIDCIAMNVNDLLAIGAEPLAFVDYLAMESVDERIAGEIAIGLAKGAEIANISLIGGETATLPEIVKGFDLVGTCVGIVDKDEVITGDEIEIGDVILALKSSGIHSNGLTLARKVVKLRHSYSDPFGDTTLGEELLKPTRIYMDVLELIKKCEIHGMAHITGGGLLNLRRISNHGFQISNPIAPQPIFKFVQEEGNIDEKEMYRTFNMGMGFMIILPEDEVDKAKRVVDGEVVGEIRGSDIKMDNLVI